MLLALHHHSLTFGLLACAKNSIAGSGLVPICSIGLSGSRDDMRWV